jgi:hypothetical protein
VADAAGPIRLGAGSHGRLKLTGVESLAVITSRRILMWVGISLASLFAGYGLLISVVVWFGNYMSEGVLETETLKGDVFVALNNNPPVRRALLSACHSKGPLPPSVSALLASGLLAEIPSGTKMHLPEWGDDSSVGTMTIAKVRLKGRQVWACRGQFALLHAMP